MIQVFGRKLNAIPKIIATFLKINILDSGLQFVLADRKVSIGKLAADHIFKRGLFTGYRAINFQFSPGIVYWCKKRKTENMIEMGVG